MRSLNLVFNCSKWGGGGCFVCCRVILRGCVALLPACPVDLRCPGCSVVEYPGKVACPSGRRCSTRNAVWCHSHPGFKSQRYRHCRPAPMGPGGFVMPGWCVGACACVRAGAGLLGVPVGGGLLGCLVCPWAAARPRAVRAASFARRVVSKPGQALPPPTGPAAWPSVPSGTLHTGGACVAVTSPARPYRMGTAAWVSGLSTQWCPVADADWCVVSKLGQAPSPPMGTAAWPSGTLRTGGACVAVTSPARPCRRPRAPQPTDSIAWPSKSCGALHTGRANPLRGR